MMKFVSKSIRSECVHISVYIVCRHSDCGMEGYKLETSIVTSMASSGTCASCSIVIRVVELCK